MTHPTKFGVDHRTRPHDGDITDTNNIHVYTTVFVLWTYIFAASQARIACSYYDFAGYLIALSYDLFPSTTLFQRSAWFYCCLSAIGQNRINWLRVCFHRALLATTFCLHQRWSKFSVQEPHGTSLRSRAATFNGPTNTLCLKKTRYPLVTIISSHLDRFSQLFHRWKVC